MAHAGVYDESSSPVTDRGNTFSYDAKRARRLSSSSMTSDIMPGTPSSHRSPATPFTPSSEKNSKGLRHFSMKVCQKVKEKGVTTYNEVADELVHERQLAEVLACEQEDGIGDSSELHGPKNIRRRVYDALNVLMAMNIISKEKKEIRWIGLPNNSVQEYTHMEELRNRKLQRISRKKKHLQELILQTIAFKNLISHNKERQKTLSVKDDPAGQVPLPFVIINTARSAAVSCQMKADRSEYFFDFDSPFELHDDIEILKRMGMTNGIESGTCSAEELQQAKALIPPELVPLLESMVKEAKCAAPAEEEDTQPLDTPV